MYIKVWVVAGAKGDRITARGDKGFDVWVRAPAEQNLANTRVRELMAEHFSVPVNAVRILSGHHSPSKILIVDR